MHILYRVLFYGMATDKTVSYPVRIPKELDLDLQSASDLTSISKQDLIRLCLRIGLIDLQAAEHNLHGIVKRIADDKGVSFTRYAHHQTAVNKLMKGGTLIASRTQELASEHPLNEDPTTYSTDPPQEPLTGH